MSFFESSDFEDLIRNAISLGGDSDTLACIAGGVAQAFYGRIPPFIEQEVLRRLDPELRSVVEKFTMRFVTGKRGSTLYVHSCRRNGSNPPWMVIVDENTVSYNWENHASQLLG